jgi:ABC-type lipoprotein release transport system permease subunit
MIEASWRWALADVRRGWRSLLVVAMLVALAGGSVMAGVAGARRAGESVERFLAAAQPSDVNMFTRVPLPTVLHRDLDADPRVDSLRESRVALAGPSTMQLGIEAITLVAGEDFWTGASPPRILAGRAPTGTDEVAIAETTARTTGLAVGDTVEFDLLMPDALEACFGGGVCEPEGLGAVTVTALLRVPEDLTDNVFGQSPFYAPADFLDERGGDALVAGGFITEVLLADDADLDGFVGDYSVALGGDGNASPTATDFSGASRAADLQADALLVGSLIAGMAAITIVGQAYGRQLQRRRSDAPALLAIGMTRRQRTVAAFLPGLVASVAGAALAVPVAVALSPVFPLALARRADPDVGVHLDLQVIAVGSIVLLVIASIAAAVSATGWSRITRAGGIDRDVSFASRLVSDVGLRPNPATGSRFALDRGSPDRRTPVASALLGSTMAIAFVVGAAVLASSLDGLLSTPARYGATWDLLASTGGERPDLDDVPADPGIDAVAEVVTGELNLGRDGVRYKELALGLSPMRGDIGAVALEGRSPRSPDEALLGSDTMATLGASVGDSITADGPRGATQLTVVGRGIVPLYGSPRTDKGVVVPVSTYEALGGDELATDIDVERGLLVRLEDPTTFADVASELEAAGLRIDEPFRQASVSALAQTRQVPTLVAVFAGLLGAAATFNVVAVTGRRRRGELAVLRALGARPGDAGATLVWQAVVIALVAVVVGVPLGLVAGRQIWQLVATRTNVVPVAETPWRFIAIIAVVAVIGAATVLATGPAWVARRRPPFADLRSE